MDPEYEPAAVEGAAAVTVEHLSSAAELIILLVPTGVVNTSMAPSSVVGPVGPTFFGLPVTSTSTPYISGLATVMILVLLPDGAPSTVVGPGSGPRCVLVPDGVGNTSLTVAKSAANLFFVLVASVVSEGIDPWTSATSMTVSELDADFIFVPATSFSVSAAPYMLAVIVTDFTSRTIISPTTLGLVDVAFSLVATKRYRWQGGCSFRSLS
jgi:hypothetical protein